VIPLLPAEKLFLREGRVEGVAPIDCLLIGDERKVLGHGLSAFGFVRCQARRRRSASRPAESRKTARSRTRSPRRACTPARVGWFLCLCQTILGLGNFILCPRINKNIRVFKPALVAGFCRDGSIQASCGEPLRECVAKETKTRPGRYSIGSVRGLRFALFRLCRMRRTALQLALT
jgi:hypothetical protein